MEPSDQKSNNLLVIGFDLDNTLYPSTPEIQSRVREKIYQKLAHKLGVEVEKARDLFEKNYHGDYLWSHSGTRTIAHLAKEHGKVIESDLVQEALETADVLNLINPNPELVSMLERLYKKYRLDLITGSNSGIAHEKLSRIGITLDLFGCFFANAGSKTTGEIYQRWLSEIKVPPSQVMYVGDNVKQDIESPMRLGIQTCLVGRKDPRAQFSIQGVLDLEKLLIEI